MARPHDRSASTQIYGASTHLEVRRHRRRRHEAHHHRHLRSLDHRSNPFHSPPRRPPRSPLLLPPRPLSCPRPPLLLLPTRFKQRERTDAAFPASSMSPPQPFHLPLHPPRPRRRRCRGSSSGASTRHSRWLRRWRRQCQGRMVRRRRRRRRCRGSSMSALTTAAGKCGGPEVETWGRRGYPVSECSVASRAATLLAPATADGRREEQWRKREREREKGKREGGGRRGERMICGPHKLLGLTIFFV